MKKQLSAVACAVALAVSAPTFASDTSSSIRGLILNPMGDGAPNTTITIRHEPTGAEKVVKPNASGAFVVSGLRVGGPYTIVIDSESYRDQELREVFLDLGTPFQINRQLEDVNAGNKVVITGNAADFRYPNSGSSSTFGTQEIENSPSFGRDLKDVLRRNPLVNIGFDDTSGMSIAGNNPRFNSISVDGVRQDDDFGLNGTGYPTQRSPISIDAIDQISVEANPFDASQGGFTGGKISIVTKSGTNELTGSVFYEKADGNWAGDIHNDSRLNPNDDNLKNLGLDEKTYGFGVGGPVIEDKLFFYANYEKFERNRSLVLFPEAGTDQRDRLIEIIDIARNTYDVNAGTWDTAPVEEDQKILLKLDWDINDYHRASFTYQNTDGELTTGYPREVDGAFDLSSNWMTRGDELTSFSAHWYADWTENFSTEVKFTDKKSKNLQSPLLGKEMGAVSVDALMQYIDQQTGQLAVDGNGDPLLTTRTVNLGPDLFRHANDLNNDTMSFNIDATYLLNDHTITFGWQHEELDVFNIFIPESLGVWEFDSIQDFQNGDASSFSYQNAVTNNPADGAAEFSYTYDNFYIQDTWDYSLDLQLGFGLRFEHIHSGDRPTYNSNFYQRYGFANNESLDGDTLWLPRFSFKYTGVEDLVLRGGVGLFSGGRPNVWISNAFTNDGVTIVRPYLPSNPNDPDYVDPSTYLNGVDITEIPQEILNAMESGDGNTTPIDPDFKIPTHWQYSFGADYVTDLGFLGNDWDLSAEIIYKDIVRDVRWVDLARGQENLAVSEVPGEGRPIYGRYDPINGDDDHYDILMTNGKGGRSLISTFSAFKAFENGLKLDIAYTNQDVTELVAGSSSTAESSYQYTAVWDRQNPTPATASYLTEHSLKLNLDYSAEWFDGYKTHFGLFVKRSSGRPYSWVLGSFRDTDFGDPSRFDDSDSYLPYIPTGPNDPAMDYDSGLSYEEIIAHLQDNGLPTAGGTHLKRNDYRSPWNTVSNFSIRQEVPGFRDGDKGEVYFTIENLLNLLDSSKGQIYYNRFGDTTQILFDYDLNADGQYIYQRPFGGFRYGSPADYRADKSIWRLKAGFKYRF